MDRFPIALRRIRRVLTIAVAGGLLLALSQTQAAISVAHPWDSYVPHEVLVKFKETTSGQARAQSITARLRAELEDVDRLGLTRVKLIAGESVEDALAAFEGDPDVEYVQPNYIYTLQAIPNDPMFNQLWGLRNTGQTIVRDAAEPDSPSSSHNPGTAGSDMSLASAWDVISDCSSVIVGVIDSGINYTHEDLAANLWNDPRYPNHGYDFVGNTNDPMDLNGHGTHVAGTIGAVGNNGRGTTGVCWKAKIMALRACNALGQCTTSAQVSALNFAVAHGAKVINMSLGGRNLDPAMSNAVLNAGNSGIVVVVAAGNEANNNDTTPTYPCNFPHPNVVCVAALDQAYELASFSNYGLASVHVGAPGVNVVSTWAGSQSNIIDTFNTGGVLSWNKSTTTGAGWVYERRNISGQAVDLLLDPAGFPNGRYRANTDDRVYKAFNLGSSRVATLSVAGQFDLAQGDYLYINMRAAGGDPFAGGTQLLRVNGSTDTVVAFPDLDISGGIGPSCALGFRLLSGLGPPRTGVGIVLFMIKTLQLNNVTYDVLAGTSMATPHVAGLAAMLRAYNPNYTVADVVTAIKSGGTAVASLAGKTTTSKAVNAMGSLAYINPPTGVTATVAK